MKTIIALSGKMGCGKSTIARHVYNKLDSAMIIPLAGIAKQCVELITGVSMLEHQPDGSYDYSQKQKAMTLPGGMELGLFIREFAEAVRGIDKTVWIDATLNVIDNTNRKYYIIPDMRMRAEYNILSKLSNSDNFEFYAFRIESKMSSDSAGRVLLHHTENELDNEVWDAVYNNNPPIYNADSIANQIVNHIR